LRRMEATSNTSISEALHRMSVYWLPEHFVSEVLFEGQLAPHHKTKYFFKEIADRYKEAIKALNGAMNLNVAFAFIALYAYFALPPTGSVQVPFVGLSVSRDIWVSLVPLIAFFLQTLTFTAFIWFLLLRVGLRMLIKERESQEDFGDITNIA